MVVQRVALVNQNVGPLREFALLDVERDHGDSVDSAQTISVSLIDTPHSASPARQVLELSQADGRLQIRKFKIVAYAVVSVVAPGAPRRPALILQFAEPHMQLIIIRGNQAALSGGYRFVGRKREAPGAPKRSQAFTMMF